MHKNHICMSFFFTISKIFYLLIVCVNLFLVNSSTTYAQELLVTPLIKNKNFQNVEFYNFLEDKKGFLWIGSNHGVFRYDGKELLNFNKKDSTFFYDVLNIIEDKNGRIWLVTFQKGLIYFDYATNEFKIPQWNNHLRELLAKNWVSNLFVAPDSSLWLQKFAYAQDSVIDFFQVQHNKIIPHQLSVNSNLDSFLESQIFSPKQQQFFSAIQKQFSINQSNLSIQYVDFLFRNLNKTSMVSYNRLFPVRNKNDSSYLFRKIIRIDSSYFLGLVYNGFITNPLSQTPNYFLSKYQINDIYKLSDGQYLFSTNHNGVLKCSSMSIKRHTFNTPTDLVVSTHVANNHLYIKTQKNIYKQDSPFLSPKLLLAIKPTHSSINSLETFLVWDSTIIINNIAFYRKNVQHLFPLTVRSKLRGRSKSIQIIKDSLLLFTSANGFIILNKNWELHTDSKQLGYTSWTYSSHLIDTAKIWLGTNSGIIEFDYNTQKFTHVEVSNQDLEIKTIRGYKKTGVFIGTQRNGIFISTPKQQFINITKNQNLTSNHIRSILLENDSTAWIGTNNGVNKIIFSAQSDDIKVSTYLTGVFIDDLDLYGNNVFAVSNGELISFPKNMPALNPKISSILITGLSINGLIQKAKNKKIRLKRHENNIQIFYRKPNFNETTSDTFVYALLSENNIDTIWKQTTDLSISFLLNPGQYVFLLTTKEELNKVTPTIENLIIHIQKHFTDTVYFSLLIYLLFILGTSSVAYIIIGVVKNRIKLQKALVESQLKLLRTQMNPHFLFNTLNSISGHIAQKNIWKSIKYISKFSQLVRNILESSKESFLPLKEELKILEDYVYLEKMRLGEQYIIQIAPPSDTLSNLFYIPPMLIQPFIENAIIHGVTPKQNGQILILFESQNDQTLKITIQDNGIGRKASMNKPSFELKESIGISNVDKRISIINKTYKTNIRLSIYDLYSTTGEAEGTKVQIFLPLFNYTTSRGGL